MIYKPRAEVRALADAETAAVPDAQPKKKAKK